MSTTTAKETNTSLLADLRAAIEIAVHHANRAHKAACPHVCSVASIARHDLANILTEIQQTEVLRDLEE